MKLTHNQTIVPYATFLCLSSSDENVTGLILEPGKFDCQSIMLINEGDFSLTWAEPSVSHVVADRRTIERLTSQPYTWSAEDQCWYNELGLVHRDLCTTDSYVDRRTQPPLQVDAQGKLIFDEASLSVLDEHIRKVVDKILNDRSES